MKINKQTGDPIDIEWLDAVNHSGWVNMEYASTEPKDSFCHTRGYFVTWTDNFLVVALTISEGEFLGVQHIPMGWILKIDGKKIK